MWNLVSIRLEAVLVSVRISARFAPNVPYAYEIVLDTMMVLLRVEAEVDALFGLFGDSAKLDAI